LHIEALRILLKLSLSLSPKQKIEKRVVIVKLEVERWSNLAQSLD